MDIRAIQRVLEQRLDADVRMAPKEMPAWVDPVDLACEVRIGGDAWILAIEAKAAVGNAAASMGRPRSRLSLFVSTVAGRWLMH